MVREGYFGFKDYFKSLCDAVEGSDDFYLLGHDFASYLEAQVCFQFFFLKNFPKVEFCMIYKGVICRPRQTKHLWIKRNGWGWVFLALPGLGDSAVIEQSRNMLRRRGESNHASVQCSIFFVGDSFEDGTNHEWTRDVCNLSIAWMKPWLVFVLYTAWHRFQFV